MICAYFGKEVFVYWNGSLGFRIFFFYYLQCYNTMIKISFVINCNDKNNYKTWMGLCVIELLQVYQ